MWRSALPPARPGRRIDWFYHHGVFWRAMILVRALISLMLVAIILLITVSLFCLATESLLHHFWAIDLNLRSVFHHYSADRKEPPRIRDREVLLLPRNTKLAWKEEQDSCGRRDGDASEAGDSYWPPDTREHSTSCKEVRGPSILLRINTEGRGQEDVGPPL
jgi:hypothetical protein